MNKKLTVTLSIDAKTGEVTAVRNSFDKLDRKVGDVKNNLTGMATKLVAVVGFTGAVYGLAKAFSFVVRSGFDYNKSMDASTAKLTAMISASKGYETISGHLVSAQERQVLIARETAQMMEILKKTNAQTAMGMSELVDIYALAKPGMDRYKWAVQDQIEIVKLASNTASTFGMTAEELSSGIDDLAAGTWEASSGFGKMMKSLGVSKAEYQATADKVAYLKEKMKETGEAQDTWAVATSNLQVAWDNLAGQITQPIFDGVKEAIKYVTTQMNTYAPDAMQVFSDALVGMVNGSISAVGTLIGWISKLISGFRIAYAGYQKLAGAARVWWNGNNADNTAKLQALQAEQEELKRTGHSYGVVRQKIRALKKDMAASNQGAKLWAEADRDLADIASFDAKMQGIASTVKGINIKKGIVNPITEAVDPAEQLAYKLNKFDGQTKTNTKSLKAQAKAAEKALKAQRDLNREYLKLTGDKSGLFQLDVEDTMQKFIDSGAYSAEQLSKIYDGMWDDFKSKGENTSKSVADMLQDAFNIDNDSVFANFLDALEGSLSSFITAFSKGDAMDVSKATGDLIMSSLPPGYKEAAMIISAVGSSYLSEAEIRAAAGRSGDDINSKGTAQIISTLESANAKEYAVSNSMLQHLKSMDENLIGALNNVQGLDLSGSTYTPQTSSIAGGVLFASNTELIGAGIKFSDQAVSSFIEGVEANGYEAVKKTSSILGIFTSESISESLKELPDKTKKQIGEAFNQGLQSTLDGLEILGFDASAIEKQLQDYVISIGKIDFKDLSIEEQAQALNRALTEQLNGAISGAMDNLADPYFYEALQDMATAGEEITSTIARVAVGFETVGASLAALGTEVSTFTQSNALIEATGSLSAWKSAQDQFIGMLSDGEQKQYMENMLTQALAVYDIALPASKAQFIALKKETEAKILSTQAQIDTMKASIRADIAANKYKIKADGNYARSAISTAENINKAAILTGKSANDMIKAAKGAAVSATKIDYTKAYEDDVGLQALETELDRLQGIYGTLMSNMGDFASYYDGVESSAQAAADSMTALEKSLIAIADLKAVWTGDDLSAKKIILDATKRITGLSHLTYENFLDEFEKATANGLGMDEETLSQWTDMSNALRSLHDVEEQRLEADKEIVRKDISFYEGIIGQIESAYTGSNSYLNSFEKADYLAQRAAAYQESGDNANYIQALQDQLALDKKMSTTRENYEEKFDKYITELKEQKPEATTDDVVDELKSLQDKLSDIEDAIESASYQEAG